MKFHFQDINQPRRHLFAGRCWWNNAQFLQLEWAVLGPCGVAAEVWLNHYGDTALLLHVSAILFSVYIGTENRTLYKLLEGITKRPDEKYTNGRIVGVNLTDSLLRLSLWDDPMESRSTDPWWWHISIDLADLLFGKVVHTCEIRQFGSAEIDMPEGTYPATYKVERRTWKRPRWFPKVSTAILFDIPAGIPHWGKGDNS